MAEPTQCHGSDLPRRNVGLDVDRGPWRRITCLFSTAWEGPRRSEEIRGRRPAAPSPSHCLPRARGDTRVEPPRPRRAFSSAPRARGYALDPLMHPDVLRVCPARAGINPTRSRRKPHRRHPPRAGPRAQGFARQQTEYARRASATFRKNRRINIRISSKGSRNDPETGARRRSAVPDPHRQRTAQVRDQAVVTGGSACRQISGFRSPRMVGTSSATVG